MGQLQVRQSRLVGIAFVACAVLLSSCSGGGGGGGGGALILITADGASQALWTLVNGVPTVPASCPTGVFINGRITFTFDGAVDPASIPVGPNALGSLNVVSELTSVPAFGTFTVEDDPAFPAGNHRRVVFTPALPANPNSPCSAGVEGFQNYQVVVPFGASVQIIVVDGEPIGAGAVTCFRTCGCPSGGGCTTAFQDAVPGGPYVTSTTPLTSDPSPPGVDVCAIANDTIQINVSEALDPTGIDLANVRVIDTSNGTQVPGSLVFFQATSVNGPSRIDYVASSQLAGNRTYQVLLNPAIHDFSGNPIEPAQGNPGAQLFFATNATQSQPAPPLVENFDTLHVLGTTGAVTWPGNGFLQATFPLELTGTGADGAFNAPAATTTVLDTAELIGGQPRMGIWNFTDVNIPATATVRVVGPYQAHFRCTGMVTLNGVINGNARYGAPDFPEPLRPRSRARHPEQQRRDELRGERRRCERGRRRGRNRLGQHAPPGQPADVRVHGPHPAGRGRFRADTRGDGEHGLAVEHLLRRRPGRRLGCFPAAGPGCTVGDIGGLGGAGGTAARVGEAGLPRVATPACTPTAGVIQPLAQPSPIPVVMMPPITLQSAGSGGGGGGDHLDANGVPPNNDDQGGGGGGGGGGIRISCVGPYTQGPGGTITVRGSQGAGAQTVSGCGGSGSGGEVWIQTFSALSTSATAVIDVTGPIRLSPAVGLIGCSNQAAGGGGAGLVQLEAGQGPTPTANFNLQPVPTPTSGAVFSAPPFAYSGAITGQGRSGLRYSGVVPSRLHERRRGVQPRQRAGRDAHDPLRGRPRGGQQHAAEPDPRPRDPQDHGDRRRADHRGEPGRARRLSVHRVHRRHLVPRTADDPLERDAAQRRLDHDQHEHTADLSVGSNAASGPNPDPARSEPSLSSTPCTTAREPRPPSLSRSSPRPSSSPPAAEEAEEEEEARSS